MNGVAVIEDFFTEHEADELRKAGLELCENAPEEARTTFGNHMDDRYFFESSNKIHYFYEKSALDDSGKLLVNKQSSFNKVRIEICFNEGETITLRIQFFFFRLAMHCTYFIPYLKSTHLMNA